MNPLSGPEQVECALLDGLTPPLSQLLDISICQPTHQDNVTKACEASEVVLRLSPVVIC